MPRASRRATNEGVKPLALAPLSLSLIVAACGTSPGPTPQAPPPPAEAPPASPPAPSPPPIEQANPEPATPPAEASAPAPAPLRFEKEGADALRIEGDGVRLIVRVRPMQAVGGWGVKVFCEASSLDGAEHKIVSMNGRVIQFSGTTHQGPLSGGFGEGGAGKTEIVVKPSGIVKFERGFTGAGGKPGVVPGESLRLRVWLGSVLSTGSEASREWGEVALVELWVPRTGRPKLVVGPPQPEPPTS